MNPVLERKLRGAGFILSWDDGDNMLLVSRSTIFVGLLIYVMALTYLIKVRCYKGGF